jgi:hypothetical protein
MNHAATRFAIVLMIFCASTSGTSAATALVAVTPASVKQNGDPFSVTARRSKNGLIHFTIGYRPPAPQQLVTRFELRDGETTLAKTETSTSVRDGSAGYHVTIATKYLAGSTFELSHYPLSEAPGRSIEQTYDTVYRIDLAAFGKDAVVAEAD